MGRHPKWKIENEQHQIITFTLSSWKYFHDFIAEEFLDYRNYVFRGQCNENWHLEPTLNRFLKEKSSNEYKKLKKSHLDRFKFSLRGRTNILKNILNNEDELWALGQHHGLMTPMLDFSFSPYVAAYFAFFDNHNNSDYRVIYAIHDLTVDNEFGSDLKLYKPYTDHNQRLLNQSGLFVKFETNIHIEKLFENKFPIDNDNITLIKIRIPNKDRNLCLRTLNRMNINHNTLFPDLEGTSIFCNLELSIKNY